MIQRRFFLCSCGLCPVVLDGDGREGRQRDTPVLIWLTDCPGREPLAFPHALPHRRDGLSTLFCVGPKDLCERIRSRSTATGAGLAQVGCLSAELLFGFTTLAKKHRTEATCRVRFTSASRLSPVVSSLVPARTRPPVCRRNSRSRGTSPAKKPIEPTATRKPLNADWLCAVPQGIHRHRADFIPGSKCFHAVFSRALKDTLQKTRRGSDSLRASGPSWFFP